MCRPQFAGYGTWNVPTTFQSECPWASAPRFFPSGLTPKNRGAYAAPLRCLTIGREQYKLVPRGCRFAQHPG